MPKKTVVLGAGISGLVAASYLSKQGHQVELIEQHDQPGGRCREFKAQGFTFDMGPSWYWMPELFENFFSDFGEEISDHYDLVRLDPSYKVFFLDSEVSIPAKMEELTELIETIEPGAGKIFENFMAEAKYKYEVGMGEFVYKPSLSLSEFIDPQLAKQALKLNLFSSFKSHISKRFKNPKLRQLLEFPVLFLGAKPEQMPSLYSMMNYADSALGTWYPMKGMNQIAKGFERVAKSQGVSFSYNTKIEKFEVEGNQISSISTDKESVSDFDQVLSAMDYHFTENLLDDKHRSYSEKYWDKRKLSPSSLLFYVGVNKKVEGLLHHNLFFDTDFDSHAEEIYDRPKWPEKPLFYVCCPSKTDKSVAPEGMENLFVLIPIAVDLEDDEKTHDHYFNMVMDRMEKRCGVSIKEHVIFRRNFSVQDFKSEYNSLKGNAYGLANTLLQTAFLKPKMKSKKINNLYYTGQLTVPGPGLPPSIVSGQVAAKLMS